MRNIILLICLACTLGYITCKNFSATKTPPPPPLSTVPAQQPSDGSGPMWNAARVSGQNDDTSGTRIAHIAPRPVVVPMDGLPRPSASRRAYLTSGYWNFQMAYVGNDTMVHIEYLPKWLKFNDNLSFEIIIDKQVAAKGFWNYDEVKNEIYLSCPADPWINNTWKVQEKGFVMVWLGNTNINVTGIQTRITNHKTLPQ
jgi:hypothetical protein